MVRGKIQTNAKPVYRFRRSFFGLGGKSVLQIGRTFQYWDTNTGLDDGSPVVVWEDANWLEMSQFWTNWSEDQNKIARLESELSEIKFDFMAAEVCCCGAEMKGHALWDNHSPVSMYHNCISNLQDEITKLKNHISSLKRSIFSHI